MASSEQKNDLYNGQWPSDPKNYQWKGTLSVHNGTSNVLAHCKPRKQDVFIKIKQTQDDDSNIDAFTENTTNLINIQHNNLLTPVHAFVHKSEIWVIYPRHSGGPLIEVLTSHYPNGIPDESIVSCILYDISLGLHNLHKQQQCHRNIRASSIHIDIDNGYGLLTEFDELKEIKWKHAAGRRNTFVSPDRAPFTDPLILFGDERASWYAGDIYAFGITALQLTYGNTPPLNTKNIIAKQATNITCDLYDKKCPFSKSFESLIKDCCASKLQNRIKINKLCEHKFFTKRAQHLNIKQYFGHILKSTEKRINSSLQAPKRFNNNQNNIANNNNENIDQSNENNIKNGMKINIEPNGNHEEKNNNIQQQQTEIPLANVWSFSTTIKPEDLVKNGNDTPVINNYNRGPTLHNPMGGHGMNNNYAHDPTQGHGHGQMNQNMPSVGKKTRSYHVSFSQSESESISVPPNNKNNNNNNTVQINRFKVEFGSRLSESGTVATQIEPSESNNEPPYDTYNDDSDEENDNQNNINDNDDEQSQSQSNPQNNSLDSNGNQQQTIKIKRFHITPAKPDISADELDEQQQQQQPQPQPPPKQVVVVLKKKEVVEDEYILPNKCKNEWSKSELSEWVGSFGNAFKPYIQAFIDNGIDGAFMDDINDDDLKEIVPSNLHRKRIFTSWKKLEK